MKQMPYHLQILLLVLSVFLGLMIANLTALLHLNFLGITFNSLDLKQPNQYLIVGLHSQIFGFIMPFFLFLAITKNKFKTFLKLNTIQLKYILMTLGVFVISVPIIFLFAEWNSHIKEFFPNNSFIINENDTKIYQENLILSPGLGFLFYKIFVIAMLPAIGEELIFRGGLYGLLEKVSDYRMHFAAWTSGLIFAATHLQPTNLLPMTVLGAILAYLYAKFKNITYPMLFHFLFNTTTLVSGYLFPEFVK